MALFQYAPASTLDFSQHFVVLPGFLGPQLLALVQANLEEDAYVERRYENARGSLIHEMVASPRIMPHVRVLLSDPALVSFIRELTGEPALTHFSGRLYKLLPDSNQQMGWHKDTGTHKKVAISINVSPAAFAGGELLIRKVGSADVQKIHNTGAGAAVVFRVHESLEHMVLPVSGSHPKYAITGWFGTELMA